MERVGHVARRGATRGAEEDLVGRFREGDHFEEPGVNGRIILK